MGIFFLVMALVLSALTGWSLGNLIYNKTRLSYFDWTNFWLTVFCGLATIGMTIACLLSLVR